VAQASKPQHARSGCWQDQQGLSKSLNSKLAPPQPGAPLALRVARVRREAAEADGRALPTQAA